MNPASPLAEPRLRSSLFLDFDNVFSTLAGQDEATALAFATDPARWLRWLAEGRDGGPARRFLIRRCYLNPNGSAEGRTELPGARPGPPPRMQFGRFRQALTAAGLEVVDCPRLGRAKNAADIRMTIDVLDAVSGPVAPDEVVLLTSDSDFLPLLHRLRALDRRTAIVAHPAVGGAMRAAADRAIGLDRLAAGALGWSPPPPALAAGAEPQPSIEEGPGSAPEADPEDPILAARAIAAAQGRLPLPTFGTLFARRLGYTLRMSRYARRGSLDAFLGEAGLRLEAGPGGGWVELAESPEEGAP